MRITGKVSKVLDFCDDYMRCPDEYGKARIDCGKYFLCAECKARYIDVDLRIIKQD